MKCKKCGGEIAEDMPKCLWCDAVNEDYVAPEEPEKIEIPSLEDKIDETILEQLKDEAEIISSEEHQKKVAQHPAGNYLWSAFFLGIGLLSAFIIPFYVAFFHRNELEKNGKTIKFISAYYSAIIAVWGLFLGWLNQLDQLVLKDLQNDNVVTHSLEKFIVSIHPLVYVGIFDSFAAILFSYTAALLLKNTTPDYDSEDFKRNSKPAVIFSIPLMICSLIISRDVVHFILRAFLGQEL